MWGDVTFEPVEVECQSSQKSWLRNVIIMRNLRFISLGNPARADSAPVKFTENLK